MRHSAYLSAATILLLGLISVYGKGFAAGNVDRGRDIYINAGCGHCHGTYGQGGGNYGGAGPKLAPNPLDYEVIQLQIRTPMGIMPAYSPTLLSDQDIKDISAYLSSIPEGKKAREILILNR